MKLIKTKKVILTIILSIIGILILVNLFFILAPQFGRKPEKSRMAALAKESHYTNGKFRNEKDVPVIIPGSGIKLIKASQKNKKLRKPDRPLPSILPVLKNNLSDSITTVTWVGHSSVYIKMSGVSILTDPVFSKRVSPVSFFGPKSFSLENSFRPEELPLPDIILISHDHFDHLDYKTIRNHFLSAKLFIVPLGIRDHLERWGVKPEQIIEFDWWQKEIILDKLTIIAAPSQHFSGRRGQDNSTLWCSWIVLNGNESIFFSGDSGYSDHFKAIGDKYGPFDLVLMECGAYGEYWPNIHMIPEQSVQAGIDVRAKIVLPIHWGKYNLSLHPWKEPVKRFIKEASVKGLHYTIPFQGERLIIGEELPQRKWWE
jgi:L-ascorbate metabolism protein UlaG (beta-lactamase superfamily)